MKIKRILFSLVAIPVLFAFMGCAAAGINNPSSTTATTTTTTTTTQPTVVTAVPASGASSVGITGAISAKFSESMDPATIVAANFTVFDNSTTPVAVPGNVTYDIPNNTAIFAPTSPLKNSIVYTATITTAVADTSGNKLASNYVWTFTTASAGSGPAPVILGTSGNFVVLAKTGISTIPSSKITGNIGVSPAAESYLTGFSQTKATGYSTSPQVKGFLYASDMTPPTPTMMTTAISDMETAYTDAAGRTTPDFTNLGAGEIGGKTLVPGLYNWTSAVTISSDVTISGGANDVWIFQTTGNLSMSSNVKVLLSGGAQAKNIFWQVAGQATLGTGAHFEGVILAKSDVTLNTGATMNGKALSQTQVALDQATITDVQ